MVGSDFLLGILLLAIGYLFGCFSTATVVGKANHIDIREYGSGNAGTTNAMRVLGKKAGLLTFAGDFLKAYLPIMIMKHILLSGCSQVDLFCFFMGFGTVLGHNFPFWLKFKGGKGVAVTTGVFLAVVPHITIFAIILFAAIAFFFKYVSVASLISIFFACVSTIIYYQAHHGYLLIISLYMLLVLWQHRSNILRLIHGNENKIGEHKQRTDKKE